MITLCTVLIEPVKELASLMIESCLKKTKLITNIIIAQVDSPNGYTKKESQGGVQIDTFSHTIPTGLNVSAFGHSLGLHACIERVQTPYIMFCDPDVLFLEDTPSLYLKLMEKFSLNYIGCSHEYAVQHPETYFPYVVNSLVKKTDLPDNNFLEGFLYYRGKLTSAGNDSLDQLKQYAPATGKYLIRGFIPGMEKDFPNAFLKDENKKHTIDYDTGHLLYLWALQSKWRWLSFLTPDVHHYNTGYYRSNCNVKPGLPKMNLLYHLTSRHRIYSDGIKEFMAEYATLGEKK